MSSFRCAIFLLPCLMVATAQSSAAEETPDLLFQSLEPLEIRIAAPFRTLMRERPDEDELSGMAYWTENDGREIEVSVQLRTRGNYRRQPRICPFAPIRLNFRTSELEGTLFQDQDKLKLVTHCKDRSRRMERVLFREYLVYLMMNEVTDLSYRVRLLRITYTDTDTERDDRVTWAFVIEHGERFTARTGLPAVEVQHTSVAALDPAYTNLASTFQYFIGNTDFSPIAGAADSNCCHNSHLYGGDGTLLFPVAYDFDFSGMVNARYAEPNPKFRLSSVRQRLYRGRCVNNVHLAESLQRFRDLRERFYAIVADDVHLNDATRRSMSSFLDSFYEVINEPRQVESKLVERCVSG